MRSSKRVVTPSRILNDQRGVFGLWMTDFAGAIVVFVIASKVLEGSGYELLALPAALAVLAVLAPVRLTTRRKIIRDFVRWIFTPKVIHDPRR